MVGLEEMKRLLWDLLHLQSKIPLLSDWYWDRQSDQGVSNGLISSQSWKGRRKGIVSGNGIVLELVEMVKDDPLNAEIGKCFCPVQEKWLDHWYRK